MGRGTGQEVGKPGKQPITELCSKSWLDMKASVSVQHVL